MANRIILRKSKKEWQIVDKRIRELQPNRKNRESKKKEFNKFLNNKIAILLDEYEKNPECINEYLIDDKQEMRCKWIPPFFENGLQVISDRTGVPVSTIVDKIILRILITEK